MTTLQKLKPLFHPLLVYTILLAAPMVPAQSPYVPEATNRVDLNFNQDWKYRLGDASGAEAATFNDASWDSVCLPHTVRLEPKVSAGGNYRGISWYRKSFTLESRYNSRKVFIEFEAAMGNAIVWCNGQPLATHYGGYLPFTVDITATAKFDGTKNVIAVKVDNSDDPNTPPGKPQADLDFCYWGGIYANAWMHITDKTHITDAVYANKVADGGVFVTYPAVSASEATVQVNTNVKNENTASKTCSVKSSIVDSAKRVVATLTSAAQAIPAAGDYTFTQTLTVTNPKLWHPNRPYLYTLYSAVSDGSGYVEHYKTRIGIRTIKMVPGKYGFSINNQAIELQGANRHQEHLYIGAALSNSLHYRDAKKMREGGINFCRLSHYPHTPAFMDACDELGIMCCVQMPGWQYWGGTTFQQRALQDVKDMVRRDRNHPCVIIWESNLNETYSQTVSFAQSCHNSTHAEYPGNQCYTSGNAYGGTASGMVYDIPTSNCSSGKPYFTKEWSDNYWESASDTTGTRCRRVYGEYDLYNSLLIKDKMWNGSSTWPGLSADWCNLGGGTVSMGASMWCWFDANSDSYNTLAGMGTMDLDRWPKFSYYWFQAQRDPAAINPSFNSGPMVKILSYWQQGSPKPVKIASNCQQVKLYLNNTQVSTVTKDNFPNVHYPLYSANLTWQSGTLRAEGLINNTVVAADTVRTPLTASRVDLVIDTMGLTPVADGSDLFVVYAKVCDNSGTVVPVKTGPSVTLQMSGPGSIVGNGDSRVGANPARAEAGIAAFLIKTGKTAGTLTFTASSSGLTSGTAAIQTVPVTSDITGTAHAMNAAGMPASGYRSMVTTTGVFMLPREYQGKKAKITVFEPSGRVLYRGIFTRDRIDIRKQVGASQKLRIVKFSAGQ